VSKKPTHRGAAPEDSELYDPGHLPALRGAVSDLCWLLDHGYALTSSVELVGNRFELTSRQRLAVARCACASGQLVRRQQHQVDPAQLRGQDLWLDGFNVLMALESALSGGVILIGRDRCCRDMAGVHGHYRRVEETLPALQLIGDQTMAWGVDHCHWYLDSPVSNSGCLRGYILELAGASHWNWTVDLVLNPDKVLIHADQVVATSDSVILDHCQRWVNLAAILIAQKTPPARLVDLSMAGTRENR
jgi:hypothetical protein